MKSSFYNSTDNNIYKVHQHDMDNPLFNIHRIKNKKFSLAGKHAENCIRILYIADGCCENKTGNISYYLTDGDLMMLQSPCSCEIESFDGNAADIINCEFSHELFNNHQEETFADVRFNCSYLIPFLIRNGDITYIRLPDKDRMKVESMLTGMMDVYNQSGMSGSIEIKSGLVKLVTLILKKAKEQHSAIKYHEISKRNIEAVKSVINYIEKNYFNNVYIKDLSRMAMISHTCFSYIFKYLTGKSCVNYINDLRIKKAIELLREGEMNVTEICYQLGFSDSSYFSKVFKNIVGISPREYKNLLA